MAPASDPSSSATTFTGLIGVARLYGGPAKSDGGSALDGDPGQGIHVTVTHAGKVVAHAVTRTDGTFTFALAPGTYTVNGCASFDVTVRAGRTTAHDLTCPVP